MDTVSGAFFRDWYQTTDLSHYLDNCNPYTVYETETTGEWNLGDRKVFSIAGNSFRQTKYHLNGVRQMDAAEAVQDGCEESHRQEHCGSADPRKEGAQGVDHSSDEHDDDVLVLDLLDVHPHDEDDDHAGGAEVRKRVHVLQVVRDDPAG